MTQYNNPKNKLPKEGQGHSPTLEQGKQQSNIKILKKIILEMILLNKNKKIYFNHKVNKKEKTCQIKRQKTT